MIEKIGERVVELRACLDGYSIEVGGNQVWWVDYGRFSERDAECAFGDIVSALKSIAASEESTVSADDMGEEKGMEKHNSHDCVKYQVTACFVTADKQYGYQKTAIVHDARSPHEAASMAMVKFCNEDTPLAGVCVYECVLAY